MTTGLARDVEVLPSQPCGRAPPVGIGWRHPHYAQVLSQLPALDFLEVHSENFFADGGAALAVLERGRAHYPVSLHGVGLSLGSAAGLDGWHLDRLARLVAAIDPVRVSDHACFARGSFNGAIVHASDLLPVPFTSAALHVMCANVQHVQERLRRPMMVENLSAYVQWHLPIQEQVFAETDFLNMLASRTGCALLVDVNNIYVNALNAKSALDQSPGVAAASALQTCRAWLSAIAPEAVGEIHLAGHCRVHDALGDIVIDDHGSRVCEAVWQLYVHALDLFGPVPTLVEWDTDIPELDVLLTQADAARHCAATGALPV